MFIHTITTYLTSVPPAAIAIVVALCYVYVAGGRWAWPMLLDAGLLGLYLWKPSVGMLGFVLVLGAVRHIPALAREVVVLFKLDTFDGWSVHALLFALPALKVYATAPAHTQRTAPPMPAPPVAPTLIPEQDMPLLLGEGLKALNADPTAPHVGVIGATRLGKTTFVGVVLAYRQPSDLVIATPKAKQYDPWFDAEVARPVVQGHDMSYAPIEHAVSQVYQEMLRRNAPGGRATPVITLVIDEWPQVVGELPSLAKKIVNLLRMGAGCGIRVILMATDVNVRGWKMDGVAGVLDNLVFAKVEDGRQWSIGRLDANWRLVSPRRLDTEQVHGLAQRVSLAGRGWAGAVPVGVGVPDPLLTGLLGVPGSGGVAARPSVGAGGAVAPQMPVSDGRTDGRTTLIEYIKAHPNANRDDARAAGHTFANDDFVLLKKAIKRGLL